MTDLNRRQLLGAASLVAGEALSPASAAQAQNQNATSRRPNVIFIISDQFRADNLGCMGMNPMNLTPNLDALAKRGTLFRNAYASQPVCAPARATMFTGQYPEKHGVWRNSIPLSTSATTLATAFRAAGYTANYIGKWHLSIPTEQGAVSPEYRGGFKDFWEASNLLEFTSHGYEGELFDGDGKPLRFSDTYRTDFLTDRAIRFLREKRTQAPFFLTISYLETHHQNDFDTYQPPKKYADQYRNPFVPQDLRPLPGSWPSQLADYYGCVKGVDDTIGRLTTALREQGLEENTIIVFTSDHGCHFKTRNTEYKRSPHDSSIHIPLIVAGPGFNHQLEVRELVSHVNLAPTLLEASNIAIPAQMQGKSMMPLVAGNRADWQNDVYIGLREFVSGRVLRTPQWTYAVAAPKTPSWKSVARDERYVEYILYDNKADPFQHTNLAGIAETKEISEQLRARLLERIVQAGDPKPSIEPAWFPYV